jgi:hypothetical protein
MTDENLQIAAGEHQFLARRRGIDRRFDVSVQEDQPGQKQLTLRLGQFKSDLLVSVDALVPSHVSRSYR